MGVRQMLPVRFNPHIYEIFGLRGLVSAGSEINCAFRRPCFFVAHPLIG